AQKGVDQQVWNLIFNRPTRTAAKLKGIRNASLAGGVYYAVTTGNRFMVSADYNYEDGATVGIYSDAACTRKYSSANLTLTALETKVWVKVTAEDGVTSVVAPLQITTSNLTAADDVYQGAMAGNGIIQVAGATQFNGDVVEVELPAGTKKYQFAASGLNGYRIRVYTDDKASLLTDSMQVLTLDSGLTKLYIDAIKGSEHKEFVVEIKAPQYYSFTDKATDWAKAYVEKLGTSGLAIMKGDEHMKFNGDNNLTRYEMAIMMVRVAGINKALYSKLSLTFTDAKDIPAWAADYLKAAYKYEMIGGYGVYEGETVVGYEFAGEKNATRSEFLKVFMNAVTGDATLFYEENKEAIDKKIEAKKFNDLDDMEDWAVPYVYSAIYKDVIKGDQNQKINPQDLITRNEVAVILGRYLCGMN
ncbi:MAG: S-layer homology domain-containing protein, partial [Clostridia bacterium]|nr:S-layer homology domain-containing protein [Clostridia bacterium]